MRPLLADGEGLRGARLCLQSGARPEEYTVAEASWAVCSRSDAAPPHPLPVDPATPPPPPPSTPTQAVKAWPPTPPVPKKFPSSPPTTTGDFFGPAATPALTACAGVLADREGVRRGRILDGT